MTLSRWNLFLLLGICVALAWADSAQGKAIKENGVQVRDSDAIPGDGFEWEGVGPDEVWEVAAFNRVKTSDKCPCIVATGGQSPVLQPDGSWAVDSFFDITYRIDFQVNDGPIVPVTGNGTAHIVGTAPPTLPGDPIRTFDTEMLALNLSGFLENDPNQPFLMRTSTTRPSPGHITLTSVGGGQYQIDSFFDVFTELSIDGGASWTPGQAIPEPTAPVLAALGGLAVARRRRRRR